LKALKVYKYCELEKLYNSKLYSDNYTFNLTFMVKGQELFDNLIILMLNDNNKYTRKKDVVNFIKTTKLYQIYNDNKEKNLFVNMFNDLNLDYQYLFSIFIRDFFIL